MPIYQPLSSLHTRCFDILSNLENALTLRVCTATKQIRKGQREEANESHGIIAC